MAPVGAVRAWIAMPSALVTSPAVGDASIDRSTPGGNLVGLGMAPLGPAGGAGQAGAAHQQGNSVVTDHDAAAKAQLGMHPQGAVSAAGVLVTLTMRSVSQAWRIARADGGRVSHA